MAEIKDEILAALSKVSTYVIGSLFGLVGKICFDIISGKKLTIIHIIASAGLAFVAGIVAGEICDYNGWIKQKLAVCLVSALLSEKIFLAVFSLNFKKEIAAWFSYWAKRTKP